MFPKYLIESDGQLLYTVKARGVGPWRTHVFFNSLGNAYLEIKRKASLFKYKFEILKNGVHFAFISQVKKASFKNSFEIDSYRHLYFVEGSFAMREFTVHDAHEEIAKISRKPMKKKDQYGIAMKGHADEDIILSLAICMEIVRRLKRARKSG